MCRLGQPGQNPDDSDPHSGENVLETRFWQPPIPGLAQTPNPNPLRQAALHAGPHRVGRLKLRGRLAHSSRLQGDMLLVRSQRHFTSRAGRAGAIAPLRTRRTDLPLELHVDHLLPVPVCVHLPVAALGSRWASQTLRLPIDRKTSDIKPLASVCLPAWVVRHRSQEGYCKRE